MDALSSTTALDWLPSPQRLNCYSYCRNNPLVSIDPTGQADEPAQGSQPIGSANNSPISSGNDTPEQRQTANDQDFKGKKYESGKTDCSGYARKDLEARGDKELAHGNADQLEKNLSASSKYKKETDLLKATPGSYLKFGKDKEPHIEKVIGFKTDQKGNITDLKTFGCRVGDSHGGNKNQCGEGYFSVKDQISSKTGESYNYLKERNAVIFVPVPNSNK